MFSSDKLIGIYDALMHCNTDRDMKTAWGAVFGLDQSSDDYEDNIVLLLTALRKQIDNNRKALNALNVPAELTHPGFERFKDTASTSLLSQPWANHKANIKSPECRKILEWSAWALKDVDVSIVNEEDLTNLLKELQQLESTVINSSISEELKEFLLENIKEMRHAILMAKVNGAEAVKAGVDSVAGSFVTIDESLINEVQTNVASKSVVKTFFETVKRFAEAGDCAEKFITLGNRVGQTAGDLVSLINF